jgi:putative endonuclease
MPSRASPPRTPPPRHPPHALGRWGEAVARELLARAGWRILERGYRLGRREIDLIARRGSLIAFVEVKTRSGVGWGTPEEAVTLRKRREIEIVARDYLMRHARDWTDVRFDVVSIVTGPGRRVIRCDHLEDAWRPDF